MGGEKGRRHGRGWCLLMSGDLGEGKGLLIISPLEREYRDERGSSSLDAREERIRRPSLGAWEIKKGTKRRGWVGETRDSKRKNLKAIHRKGKRLGRGRELKNDCKRGGSSRASCTEKFIATKNIAFSLAEGERKGADTRAH